MAGVKRAAEKAGEKMSQLRCPKCKAMHFNVQATDLQRATGEVECSNCGHILKLFLPARPLTSRSETGGRSASEVAFPALAFSSGTMCVRCAKASQAASPAIVVGISPEGTPPKTCATFSRKKKR